MTGSLSSPFSTETEGAFIGVSVNTFDKDTHQKTYLDGTQQLIQVYHAPQVIAECTSMVDGTVHVDLTASDTNAGSFVYTATGTAVSVTSPYTEFVDTYIVHDSDPGLLHDQDVILKRRVRINNQP